MNILLCLTPSVLLVSGLAVAQARYASNYTPLFLGASMVVGAVGTCYAIFSKIRSKL